MTLTDRRSGYDRRATTRKKVSIDLEWEGLNGRNPGTLSDLSETGCFILCSGEVELGDAIKVFLPLGGGMKVQLIGNVRNCVLEIGFALQFAGLTEAQLHVISDLLEKYGEDA